MLSFIDRNWDRLACRGPRGKHHLADRDTGSLGLPDAFHLCLVVSLTGNG